MRTTPASSLLQFLRKIWSLARAVPPESTGEEPRGCAFGRSKEPRSSQWTCPHGTTYTGPSDFISGARNAHGEIAGWLLPPRDGARSTNDIAQEILAVAPEVEALIEEWFAVESRARLRLLEANRG